MSVNRKLSEKTEDNMNNTIHYCDGNENPSICIPRVETEISRFDLINIFNKLQIGDIRKIDVIPSKKTNHYKIFIHFDYWYDNDRSNMFRHLLNEGGNFKVVYDFPNYLKCFKSKFS